MKVGFIGLGIMGTPMCLNLLKSDIELGVYNRTKEKAQPLADKGAKVLGTIQDLSEWADTIIIMLPDDDAVMGTISELKAKDKIVVNMSTISLEATRKLAEKAHEAGFHFVNAPVSGTKQPAEQGTLVILYGGEKELLSKLQPIFDALGKATKSAGTPEDATKLKLVINFLLGGMLESFAESIAICEKIGLDKDTFLEGIAGGPLDAPFFQLKKDNILNRHFEPAFMTKYMLKDLEYLAEELRTKKSGFKSNILELYNKTNNEFSEQDLSAIYKMLEED